MNKSYKATIGLLATCALLSGIAGLMIPTGRGVEALPRLILFMIMFVCVDLILFTLSKYNTIFCPWVKKLAGILFPVLTIMLITIVTVFVLNYFDIL